MHAMEIYMTDASPTSENLPQVLLSFDVEECFQIEAARTAITPQQWGDYPSRVESLIDWLLETLAEHDQQATFFTLGWIAERHPKMIRRIVDAGHELACHGYGHARLHTLTPQKFAQDLHRARHTLEQAAGEAVFGYRAPTFSIVRQTAWAIDVLAEQGFIYDSSIQPTRHPQYGVSDAPQSPYHVVGPHGGSLIEIPPLSWRVRSMRIPVAGGGYFRLLPLWFMRRGIAQAQREQRPAMLYFHPWEFDPDMPDLPLTGLSRWRTRQGLSRTRRRLEKLLATTRSITTRHWLMPAASDISGNHAHGMVVGDLAQTPHAGSDPTDTSCRSITHRFTLDQAA